MGSFPIYYRDDYWKIWFETFKGTEKIGAGVWIQSYKHKSSAVRAAKRQFDRDYIDYRDGQVITHTWTVSQTNPFTK